MVKRQRISCRLAAGAKLFVVLLAMAALPALTLGQINIRSTAEPANPAAPNEKKAAEAQLILEQLQKEIKSNSARLKIIDAEFQLQKTDGSSADEKQIREIEARIAELNKQLEASKARKRAEAPNPAQPATPPTIVVKPDQGNMRLWSVGPDGKAVESKPNAPKTGVFELEFKFDLPSGLGQLFPGAAKPGQPVRVHLEGAPAKQPEYKVIGPDGKEIKGAKLSP